MAKTYSDNPTVSLTHTPYKPGSSMGARPGSIAATMRLDNVREVRANLMKVEKAFNSIEARALWDVGSEIMDVAQERVPVDQGVLRSSGRVLPPVRKGDTVEVKLGFGDGGAEDYAIPIHEHPQNIEFSPRSWLSGGGPKELNYTKSGTGSKYLQGPVEAAKSTALAEIGATVKAGITRLNKA